jgi:bifunctional DNA-binding transcriptional regulator/antitoxin component of YhaV-PrlF toxin-antitoxin module
MLKVAKLPYRTRVYINNQVLVPACLVKSLGIEGVKYADITIGFNGFTITLEMVKLLRPKSTASRQFTIPKPIRERYGIRPLDEVVVLDIKPAVYQQGNGVENP